MHRAFRPAAWMSWASATGNKSGQDLSLLAPRFFLDARVRHLHVPGEVAPWRAAPRGSEVFRGG